MSDSDLAVVPLLIVVHVPLSTRYWTSKFFRPAEVELLLGDPGKARAVFGWTPRVSFEQLVELMMKADLEASRT